MSTLQADLQAYAFQSLFHTLQACLSIVMDTLADSVPSLPSTSKPTTSPHWSENEIADLIDYLYEHRSEATGSNFKTSTYNRLKEYLDERHSKTPQTRDAIVAKFRSVRGSYFDFSFLTYIFIA
jgi:hypothetical protein